MAQSSSLNYQKQFVDIIKAMLPAHLSLANEISTVLDLSLDSAYRRLRCETDFTLNEVVKLCHHFDVPLEALNNEMPNVVTFKFNRQLDTEESFHNYLLSLAGDLNWLKQCQHKKLFFAAEDIPVFYHFSCQTLSAFKMFYWMKSILGLEKYQQLHFSSSAVDEAFLRTGTDIYSGYMQVPSVEVWTEETIVSTIKQVRFYWDAGFFKGKETAFEVLDQLLVVVQNLQRMAEAGKKISPGGSMTAQEFVLYHSDLMIGTNCVLVQADDRQSSYISYNSFNSMRSTNRYFNEQNEYWIQNLISKSTLLSGVAEKQRNQFFKSMNKKLEELKNYIQQES